MSVKTRAHTSGHASPCGVWDWSFRLILEIFAQGKWIKLNQCFINNKLYWGRNLMFHVGKEADPSAYEYRLIIQKIHFLCTSWAVPLHHIFTYATHKNNMLLCLFIQLHIFSSAALSDWKRAWGCDIKWIWDKNTWLGWISMSYVFIYLFFTGSEAPFRNCINIHPEAEHLTLKCILSDEVSWTPNMLLFLTGKN